MSSQNKSLTAVLLIASLVITALAYQSVVFDFFAGDDFVHLIWLKDAVVNHELIWRNFHSSWLDGTTTKFYRPLISVFMVADYVLFNRDGTGFHITNLLFHLTSTLAIFFITRHLGKNFLRLRRSPDGAPPEGPSPDASLHYAWPFFASLFFGLYPLHPEAVSWITGRVDAVVTAFITLSFWLYLEARSRGNSGNNTKLLLFLSIVSLALGLLSKEMAITLPAVFVLFELVFPQRSSARGVEAKAMLRRALDAVLASVPFFILIAVYFCVRFLALGTMVGGYDDSLFFISDPKAFVYTWLAGLRMFFEPFNRELVSVRSIWAKGWDACLILSILFSFANLVKLPALMRLYFFLSGWLVLSLLPVYKVFAISDDLQGSRLAYLATVPLCLLLSLAVVTVRGKKAEPLMTGLKLAHSGTFAILAFAILGMNNFAWVNAGNTANAIRESLAKLYSQVPGDPQILFVGLPDQEHGAYICRNALPGMTRAPQLSRDVLNAIMVDRFEPIFPFGYIKESLYKDRDKVKIFRFDREAKALMPVSLDQSNYDSQTESTYAGEELKKILSPAENHGEVKYDMNSLSVEGGKGRWGRPELKLAIADRPCFALEFVAVTMKVSDVGRLQDGVDLLYSNDLVPEFALKSRTHAYLKDGQDWQNLRVVLPLRSLPEWSLGGKCHGFILKLPHEMKAQIEKIEILKADSVCPSISFEGGGYLGNKGYLHVTKEKPGILQYDLKLPEAAGGAIEITRANLLFEEQNGSEPSKVTGQTIDLPSGEKTGKVVLDISRFPSLGIYELRLYAKDKQGRRSHNSDHIVIARDN